MSNTIPIAVGKDPVAQSKRAVSLSKGKKPGRYDSLKWKSSDAGTTIDFGAANLSPFTEYFFDKFLKTPTLRADAPLHIAFKYTVTNGDAVDDPYVIIED
jgi:hypothetical protein